MNSDPNPPPAQRLPPSAEAFDVPDYRPVHWRRRLLILVFAIAWAILVVLTLLYPPGGVKRHAPPPPPEPARCAPGQTTGCVGGMAGVIGLPPAASQAAPR